MGGGVTAGEGELVGVGATLVAKLALGAGVAALGDEGTAVGDGGAEPQAPTIDARRIRAPGHRLIGAAIVLMPDGLSTNPVLFSPRPSSAAVRHAVTHITHAC